MPIAKDCADCNSKDRDAGIVAAFSALGIYSYDPAKSDVEARLVFEDIDGDGVAEALFTIEVDMSYVHLVVLKRKGDQWYRLPASPEFSCWCNYENAPLDTFARLQHWGYSFEEPLQPIRLIFVHSSSGGTGVYERGVQVFALHGLELQSVFSSDEEDQECPPEGNCELTHVSITVEDEPDKPRALVTHEFRRTVRPEKLMPREMWWFGLPITACKAYTWNTRAFKFVSNAEANSAYCPVQQPPPKPTKTPHQ